MIDKDGYRLNVGIILLNSSGKVFWGKRIGQRNAWQFPQGGIQQNESLQDALYRELNEELGLLPEDVQIIALSAHWISYRLPATLRRHYLKPLCIGQKQRWFLLTLQSSADKINLASTNDPEFDQWRWVSYWYPIHNVIAFKKNVYRKILREFSSRITY